MPSPFAREQGLGGVSLRAAVYNLIAVGFLTQVKVDDLTGDSRHRPRRSPIGREQLSSSSVQAPSKHATREDASSITYVRPSID